MALVAFLHSHVCCLVLITKKACVARFALLTVFHFILAHIGTLAE